MKGIDMLRSGDWNSMEVEIQADGTQIVKLTKDGENKGYRLKMRNMCMKNEEVLEDEEIDIRTPEHILERQAEAKCLISSKGGNDHD
ncbi:unnamed protein product [marine sediment metagenome]|uniref:Uncharacterized protein n=1 Tax=marine sediment metagenome TaxID=412755 RepID=X1KRL7_9ZZZZ